MKKLATLINRINTETLLFAYFSINGGRGEVLTEVRDERNKEAVYSALFSFESINKTQKRKIKKDLKTILRDAKEN